MSIKFEALRLFFHQFSGTQWGFYFASYPNLASNARSLQENSQSEWWLTRTIVAIY